MKYLACALLLWMACSLPLFAAEYASKTLREKDIRWFDAREEPFRVYGLFLPDGENQYYYRVPAGVASQVSPVFAMLSRHTAGGRVRFATDSPYVAVHAVEWEGIPRTNLTLTFSNGTPGTGSPTRAPICRRRSPTTALTVFCIRQAASAP